MESTEKTAQKLTDLIEFLPEKFASKVFFREENVSIILFALLKNQEIAAHKTPRDAHLQCLLGEAVVTIGGIENVLKKGEIIHLPKNILHVIKALKKTKLMLIK